MTPAKRDLRWRTGDTNARTIILRERKNGPVINLGNVAAARLQVRSTADTSGALYVDLSIANGRIVLVAGEGKITFTALPADTAAATWSRGFYDLKLIYADGTIRTWLEGAVVLTPGVTV